MKYKMALYGVMTSLLMVGMEKMARSDDKPAVNLSPELILIEAQHRYDSMTSYSDKGKLVVFFTSMPLLNRDPSFIAFTTKLARPNLYRIEYGRERPGDLSQGIMKTDKGIVWSAGEGDFLETGSHSEKLKNQHWALLFQDSQSGGATVIVPGAFFKTHWSNLLETFESNWKRDADEKVGDIDCYVLSKDDPVKKTLWIGKWDFLIHQIRFVTTGEISGTTTETHSDIVVNQKFSPTDFTP
jgi:outer membrane lipoprotein-sorting protein